MSVSEPGKIITPWAESGLKNPIPPAANPATGRAGFDQGFSAINTTAKEAGGIPPFGQDFNGIFYEVTNILRYMQAGGQPTFDSALATAIGGYPKGAMVLGIDGVTLWQSKVDSNSTDPNADPADWGTFDIGLKADLAATGGAGLVGGTIPVITDPKFAGGGVGDGVTNNGPMFVAASQYVGDGGSILLPPGRWRIAGDYQIRPVNFIGSGQGATVIEFDMTLGQFNGFNFQAPTLPHVGFGITNATIKVVGGRGGDAIITPTDSFVGLYPKPTFEHLSFCSDSANDPAEGFAQAHSWDWMFLLGDAMCLTMRAIDALGSYKPTVNPASQNLDGFIRTVPTQGILSARISNITTHNVANFFEIKQRTYFHLADIDVARAYKGIYDAPDRVFEPNPYAYGESVWRGVIINAQKAPVDLENRFALLAFGLVVHRAGGAFDDGTEWVGVKLKNGRANKIVAAEISSASGYSGDAVGLLFDGGDDNQVSSPSFGTLTSCVRAGVAASAEGAAQALSVTDASLSANVGTVFDAQNSRSLKVTGFRKSSAYSYTTFAQFADSISESSSRFLQTPYRATLEHADRINLYNETAGADLKRTLLDTSAGLTMATRTDSDGAGNNFFIAARTGVVVDRVELRTKATAGGFVYLNSPETQVGQLKPYTGNAFLCGTNPSPWSGGFTQTAFTVTSDELCKTPLLKIDDKILDAWSEVEWYTYQFLDRVETKGEDGARWHFGSGARRIVEIFNMHGIDVHDLAFICYDKWDRQEEVIEHYESTPDLFDEEGNLVQPAKQAFSEVVMAAVEPGERYGIRYEEALVIEAAYLRRRCDRMEARLTAAGL